MPLVLLKNIVRLYTMLFRKRGPAKKKKVIAALIGLLFLPTMIVLQTQSMFKMWLFLPGGTELLFYFVSSSMLGVMFLLFLTGIPAAMHHLFLAKDLPMLLVFPLQAKHVFAQKVVETILSNLGMFILLGFPVLLSMILAAGFNAIILLLTTIASFLFICIISGMSILISVLLARFFSVKKVRRFATFFLGIFIVLTWASFQFVRLSRLDPLSIEFDPGAVQTFTAAAATMLPMWAPSDWLVGLVHSFYRGDQMQMALYFVALIVAAGLIITVAIRLRVTLDRHDVRLESEERYGIRKGWTFKSSRMRFYATVFLKDVRLILRDTRFFQSNLILITMIIISPFLTEAGSNESGTLDILAPYIPLTILTLIASSAMGRQNMPIERLAYQYIKLSPVNLRELLIVKSMRSTFFVIAATAVGFLLSAIRFQTPSAWMMVIIIATWLLAVGGAGLGQTFGAIAGKFNWSDPRYMVDMSWTVISTMVHLLYGAIGVGILAVGVYLNQRTVAFVLFFFYVGLVFETSARIAVRRLQKLDWVY